MSSTPIKPSQINPSWFVCPRPRPEARLRLFCFPYAGGQARLFRSWPNELPESVELFAALLPGRGERINEPGFTHLLSLVEALAQGLAGYLDKPFAFFGHSMGAMISFELARHLRREYGAQPAYMFVSGRRAPQLLSDEPPSYDLPTPEFLDVLRGLNGTPDEVLAHPELLPLILPMLRADFKLVQTYAYTVEPPLNCPLIAFGGLQDPKVPREEIEDWRHQTTGRFKLCMMTGDHFFLHTSQSLLLRIISEELRSLSKESVNRETILQPHPSKAQGK